MSITENILRIGNFTSSQIHKLIEKGKSENSFSAPALTYIEEVNLERKLNRSISIESFSRDMAWGTFCESHVADYLEFGFDLVSNETILHPRYNFWAGSTDVKASHKIGEIKCYQPKKFAKYADCLQLKDISLLRKNFPEEYWQLVSNASIHNVKIVEAILFMPYEKDLQLLAERAENYDGSDQWKYRFISESPKCELAYLPENSKYKDLNRFEFEVPEFDFEFLESRIVLASKLLIER